MKTATVRDLRNNFARVSRWLAAGEKVEITKRGVALGTILPKPQPKNGKHTPTTTKEMRKKFGTRFGDEHTAWLKKVYGGKKFKDSIVLTMREEKDW